MPEHQHAYQVKMWSTICDVFYWSCVFFLWFTHRKFWLQKNIILLYIAFLCVPRVINRKELSSLLRVLWLAQLETSGSWSTPGAVGLWLCCLSWWRMDRWVDIIIRAWEERVDKELYYQAKISYHVVMCYGQLSFQCIWFACSVCT